jgi:hypothetical protein
MRKIPAIKSLKKKKDKMMVGPKISGVKIKIKRKMPRSTIKIKMLIKIGGVKKISEV